MSCRARFFFHCARFPVNSRNIVENIVHGLRRKTRFALITLMSVRISVPSISTANGISTGASIIVNRLANPESSLWNVEVCQPIPSSPHSTSAGRVAVGFSLQQRMASRRNGGGRLRQRASCRLHSTSDERYEIQVEPA